MGGKKFRRVEAHLVYEIGNPNPRRNPVTVTFAWTEGESAEERSGSFFVSGNPEDSPFILPLRTGKEVRTRWVELSAWGKSAR